MYLSQKKLSPEIISQILDTLKNGFNQVSVARMFGIAEATVRYHSRKQGASDRNFVGLIPFPSHTPEYWKAYVRLNRRRNPIKAKLSGIRNQCQQRGLAFNLDASDFPTNPICPIFGTQLSYDPDERDHLKKASIDRVNPSKGYTKDNVEIISLRANTLKNNVTKKELYALITYIDKHEKKLEVQASNTPRVSEIFPTDAAGEADLV
jgi:hypothetical protein